MSEDVEYMDMHWDLFAYIPEDVARRIASMCGRYKRGCACSGWGNFYRRAAGHPLHKPPPIRQRVDGDMLA